VKVPGHSIVIHSLYRRHLLRQSSGHTDTPLESLACLVCPALWIHLQRLSCLFESIVQPASVAKEKHGGV
jgi:hypothetical protein